MTRSCKHAAGCIYIPEFRRRYLMNNVRNIAIREWKAVGALIIVCYFLRYLAYIFLYAMISIGMPPRQPAAMTAPAISI